MLISTTVGRNMDPQPVNLASAPPLCSSDSYAGATKAGKVESVSVMQPDLKIGAVVLKDTNYQMRLTEQPGRGMCVIFTQPCVQTILLHCTTG